MYKVLLVDDEEMVTQGLSRFVKWEDEGFEIAGTAESVDSAMILLQEKAVDLVITDVQMPGQNGLDLIKLLNENYPSIKTVILSGYSDFSYAQQAIRLGALDYLTKPINFGALKTLLRRVREKLDEEKQQGGRDDQMERMLCHTLILNIANGLPYDEARAAVCLDTRCPVRAVRLSLPDAGTLSKTLEEELCRQFSPCQVVSPASGELLCVLEGSRDPVELECQMKEGFVEKQSLCIGVSEEQPGYQELRLASLQAGKAMRYQKARSCPGVVLYDQVRTMFLGNEGENNAVRKLVESFSMPENRAHLVEDFLAELVTLESSGHFSLAQAQHFCTELLIELDTPLQTLASPAYPRHLLISETLMDVLGAQSLSEIQGYMVQYLTRVLDEVRQMDEVQQSGELIDRVKKYIQGHYAENLTLAVLSEIFYVCPPYLSRLFKKKTGINFVDYLTELRMKQAKKFLEKPNLMIYTVSEMVGYENPRYFSRLFKEAMGCTPQEYRNSVLHEDAPQEE